MPHSGGGGSHGGGFHRSSGSGQIARPAMSSIPYKGARQYVYYYKNRPCVYYADTMYNPKETSTMHIIRAAVICVILLFSVISQTTICKGKLPLTYDCHVYIEDNLGIIDDRGSLLSYLEEFRERSGVTIGIVTNTPETATIGDSCEIQSYNKYVELWEDESHWLIYYAGEERDRSDDWKWNLVCGDDCIKVLPPSQENLFTEEFHSKLIASRRYTFDEAVIGALDSLTVYSGKHLASRDNYEIVNKFTLRFIAISLALLLFIILINIISILHPSERKQEQMRATEFRGEKREYKCPYCDRIYIRNQTYSCPYCGGASE